MPVKQQATRFGSSRNETVRHNFDARSARPDHNEKMVSRHILI